MTVNDDVSVDDSREVRRRKQTEMANQLVASGALDDVFARIDAGEPVGGDDGLLNSLLKATLERGLNAELTEHLGCVVGDREASSFPNSRNGFSAKTVATEVGDIALQIPRDRDGTFTPMLVRKGQRRLDGLDAMIVSLYAGGMTIRDIRTSPREHDRHRVVARSRYLDPADRGRQVLG